jgi:hypothetical protein
VFQCVLVVSSYSFTLVFVLDFPPANFRFFWLIVVHVPLFSSSHGPLSYGSKLFVVGLSLVSKWLPCRFIVVSRSARFACWLFHCCSSSCSVFLHGDVVSISVRVSATLTLFHRLCICHPKELRHACSTTLQHHLRCIVFRLCFTHRSRYARFVWFSVGQCAHALAAQLPHVRSAHLLWPLQAASRVPSSGRMARRSTRQPGPRLRWRVG